MPHDAGAASEDGADVITEIEFRLRPVGAWRFVGRMLGLAVLVPLSAVAVVALAGSGRALFGTAGMLSGGLLALLAPGLIVWRWRRRRIERRCQRLLEQSVSPEHAIQLTLQAFHRSGQMHVVHGLFEPLWQIYASGVRGRGVAHGTCWSATSWARISSVSPRWSCASCWTLG